MEVKRTARESARGRGKHPLALNIVFNLCVSVKLLGLCGIAVIALLVGIGGGRSFGSDSSGLAVFYTNDLAGYLEPCGWSETHEQLGGLYKKATYVRQYRKEHGPALIVDSGDLFFEKEEIPESVRPSAMLKAQLIGRIYGRIGCNAVNVGERDLVLGVGFVKELEKTLDLPFISANLTDAKNVPLFKPYIVKKIAGKTIGIFGLIGDTAEMAASIGRMTHGAVVVQDSIKAAESVVKELAGRVDLIIALTHEGVGRDWVTARRVPGIDLVIGGHDGLKIAEPRKVDKTQIVQAGEKGQYLGLLQVSFEADNTRAVRNSLVPLGNKIADDDEITSMILDYQKQVAALHGPGENTSAPSRSSALCSQCHQKQFSAWQATGHARAYSSLVKRKRQFDPECLACHTTRFEEPDGFSMRLQQKGLADVQCESCHGNASEHLRVGKSIMHKRPEKEVCVNCHAPDRSPTFERTYEDYLQKVKH